MTSAQINTLVNALLTSYNTGLHEGTLDAIVVFWAAGDSPSLVASEINSQSATMGYDTVTVDEVQSVIIALQQLIGQGGTLGGAATAAQSAHDESAGQTPTSTEGFPGFLGSLFGGQTSSVIASAGGIDVGSASPGSSFGTGLMIVLIAIAVIAAFFTILKFIG